MKSCINRKKFFVLSVCMAVLSITTQVANCETYGGGKGTVEKPFLICTAEQMNTIGLHKEDWDKHFKLMADIDLGSFGGADFNIIGRSGSPFRGTFDGNSKRISNPNAMLFGYIFGERAEIRNLGLVNPNTRGLFGLLVRGRVIGCYVEGGSIPGSRDDDIIGGLLSYVVDGTISNCYSSANVSGGAFVGGLVGVNDGGTISNCYSSGNVSGGQQIGGLIGTCDNGTVSQSYSTGNVTCYAPHNTGGFIGTVRSSIVENCYATGRVKSKNYAAGFIAVCDEHGDGPTKILNSYSIGRVIADWGERAGFLGYRAGGTVKGCFWDRQSSGVSWSHAGTGKTTSQMQTKSTFTSAGWDFTTPIWTIDEGIYYPRLWWENAVPVACIVGGDRVVEAGSGCEARIILDGSCSSDEDSTLGTNDDINDFDWFEVINPCDPNSDIFLGTGEIIECNLPLGEHIIILEVIDKADAFDVNEVTITVEDTTPPEFTLTVTPDVLWPANHKMVKITPTLTVSDNCDESPEVTLVSITMNEDDDAKGDGHTTDDIQIDSDGSIYLRAERGGKGTGRIYTITYRAVDDSGNVTLGSATVTVPHDQR